MLAQVGVTTLSTELLRQCRSQVISALVVFVTIIFPSPATAKLYEMLADILMAAIEVALGLGLDQSFMLG
jgi:hypothetical protein